MAKTESYLARSGPVRIVERMAFSLSCVQVSAGASMTFTIEFDQEADGRWIAEIAALPRVIVYGSTKEEAASKVKDLPGEVLKDAEFAAA